MNKIETIKEQVSIREILSHYGYAPNSAGFISCPIHTEKTASMKVYDKTNKLKCFGCGANLDVIDFVKCMNNASAKEAISIIDNMFSLALTKPLTQKEKKQIQAKYEIREKELKKAKELEKFRALLSSKIIKVKRLYENAYWLLRTNLDSDKAINSAIYFAYRIGELQWLYFFINEIPQEDREFKYIYGEQIIKTLRKFYKKEFVIMTRNEIYELATASDKGDWRTYSQIKNMLDEQLSPEEYSKFCARLADILEV